MTLTDRDRKILLGLVPFVVVLAYWFMLIAPKREQAAATGETLAAEQQRLADAQARAGSLASAEDSFAKDYATVVRLGKAVPTSVDMPSLLVQLEQAARGTGIELERVNTGERQPLADSGSAAAGVGAAPAPPAAGAPQPAPGQPAAGAPAADGAATAPPTADASVPAAGAPAAGTAAQPPAGALEVVPLEFGFNGSFFEMAQFFHRLKRFVYVDGDKVRVRGRLMTIDSVTYTVGDFPTLSASVSPSVFLTPKAEGLTAGATPAGPPAAPAPAPVDPATTTAQTGTAPPPAAMAAP